MKLALLLTTASILCGCTTTQQVPPPRASSPAQEYLLRSATFPEPGGEGDVAQYVVERGFTTKEACEARKVALAAQHQYLECLTKEDSMRYGGIG